MKKVKMILISIVVLLTSMIMFIYLSGKITIKRITENIETIEGPKEKLNENDTEIYCICRPTTSAPEWVVVGKNGIMFEHDKNPWEEIVVTGNAPKNLSYEVSGNHNIFILRGKYMGDHKVKLASNNYTFSCKDFDIEEWSIMYPITRCGIKSNYPKDGLCLSDILDEAFVPSYLLVDDDE